MSRRVQIYDTTLRDGAQQEGISFSLQDKLKIAKKLDELGVHFIEGGWPGANPKDTSFFEQARSLKLESAELVAFGSTRYRGNSPESDPNLQALIAAGTSVCTIVGKSSRSQAVSVLEVSPEENLKMIADSVKFLRSKGKRVFFDAEHFFDGFKEDPEYALEVVRIAAEAGAEIVILCDTNGGSLPQEIKEGVEAASRIGVPLGIHAHNDADLAVANTLAAVEAGAIQVQGTINGYGERCGNANLCSVIPNLKLKMGVDCIPEEKLRKLTEVSRFVSEIANLLPDPYMPYVGASAFAHKGGLHISGVGKAEMSYQHVDPKLVGNESRILISELSGISAVLRKAAEMGLELGLEEARGILQKVKELEKEGFQYENAEASFELLIRRARPDFRPPFELVDFLAVVEKGRRPALGGEDILTEAMVKIKVGGEIVHTAAEGNGPVHALDAALRKALSRFFPEIEAVKLIDYKVRIIGEGKGTGAEVRVLVESTDGIEEWRTVGCSTNIIEASWMALEDSFLYWL